MAFTNRYALLDQTSLHTVSKLRSLPEQPDEESMVAALEAQDAADRAQDAEWLVEKTDKNDTHAADGVFAPATLVRKMSWADECQDEVDAGAEAKLGAEAEAEAGWEMVTNHSSRPKKAIKKIGRPQGAAAEEKMIKQDAKEEEEDEENIAPAEMASDKTEDDADTASHVKTPVIKPAPTQRTPIPEWDDYISGMPAVFAPFPFTHLQFTREPSSSTSSSAAAPSYAAEPSSDADESKATSDTEQEEVAVVQKEEKEKKMTESMQKEGKTPTASEQNDIPAVTVVASSETPSKSKKRRNRKAAKKAAVQEQKNVAAAEWSADVVPKPVVALSHVAEDVQAAIVKPTKFDDSASSSPQPAAGSLVAATPSVEESLKAATQVDVEKTPVHDDNALTSSIDTSEEQVENSQYTEDLQVGNITLEAVAVDLMTAGSTPAATVEDQKHSSNTTQEAAEKAVVKTYDAVTAATGEEAAPGGVGGDSLEPVTTRKKKSRTRAQRKAAKEAAAAAAAATAAAAAVDAGVVAHMPGRDPLAEVKKEEQELEAKKQEEEAVEVPIEALQRKKPSGAQRRKANKAAAAAMARTMGLQVGSYFMPWYVALAVFLTQLLMVVIGIYLVM